MPCTLDSMYAECDDTILAYFGTLLLIVLVFCMTFYMFLWCICPVPEAAYSKEEGEGEGQDLSKVEPELLLEEEEGDEEDAYPPSYASVACVR